MGILKRGDKTLLKTEISIFILRIENMGRYFRHTSFINVSLYKDLKFLNIKIDKNVLC
jgi:hypothetical protein